MMKMTTWILPLAALALMPASLQAEEAPDSQDQAETRDYIAFPNHGGVRDWHADGRTVIYFQDRQKRWFKAELNAPAHELPWVQFIGIEVRGPDRLDRFSNIYIAGERHTLRSFEQVSGAKPWQAEEAAEDK